MRQLIAMVLLLPTLAFAQPAGKLGAPAAPPPAAGKGVTTQAPAAPAAPAVPAPAPAQAAAPQQCPNDMSSYAGNEKPITCTCPATSTARGSVWGSGPYTADSAVCTAALHAGATTRRGGDVTLRMLPGQPRYVGTTRNGVTTSNYGDYNASYQFDGVQATGPQQCPNDVSAYSGSSERLACTCPATSTAPGAVWGSGPYTADSAVCAAAVHAGAMSRRGGEVTVQMMPGQPRYVGSSRNGVTTNNYGDYDSSYQFEGVQAATGPQQCPDNMSAYAASDEELTCSCPAGSGGRGAVWGTDAYTADSAVCSAALHAGAVSRRGGEVTLRMLPGLPRYPGTTRNGVTSNNYGDYEASFRFRGVSTGPQICPDTMSAYADSDEKLQCVCTGEAVIRSAVVWGGEVYTSDSGVCRAARHAGVVPLTGGTVTVRMMPGQPRYAGSTRNGVQSQSYGEYGSSYRFEGAQNLAAAAPVQAPVADSLRRTGRVSLYVTFRTNSAELDPNAAQVLMQVRDALQEDPSLRLRLVGHTDNQGGPNVNIPLSQRRAASVRDWLARNGIEASRLATEGRGQNEPVADNNSDAGRSLNRRVEAVRLD